MTHLNYYSQFGRMTDPGPFADLYVDLPTDLPSLVKVVQGLIIHVFWAERYGVTLSADRQAEVQLRTMERRLARTLELDSNPLTVARLNEQKIVGNCRDFSVTLASLLQSKGIPARPRCGFGAYFMPNHFEDHWVCEYWNEQEGRWVLVDAQLDELQRNILQISFNTLDVPRDQFIVGAAAWQMCRTWTGEPGTVWHLRHERDRFCQRRLRPGCGLAQQNGAATLGLLGIHLRRIWGPATRRSISARPACRSDTGGCPRFRQYAPDL